MLKYKVIENFINEDKCSELIKDAEVILTKNSEREILNNNRQSVFSTSIIFNELLSKSKNWRDLNEKLYSPSRTYDKISYPQTGNKYFDKYSKKI